VEASVRTTTAPSAQLAPATNRCFSLRAIDTGLTQLSARSILPKHSNEVAVSPQLAHAVRAVFHDGAKVFSKLARTSVSLPAAGTMLTTDS
jgi:hypothetical protein